MSCCSCVPLGYCICHLKSTKFAAAPLSSRRQNVWSCLGTLDIKNHHVKDDSCSERIYAVPCLCTLETTAHLFFSKHILESFTTTQSSVHNSTQSLAERLQMHPGAFRQILIKVAQGYANRNHFLKLRWGDGQLWGKLVPCDACIFSGERERESERAVQRSP